jgi:cell shape-determining protein MreC
VTGDLVSSAGVNDLIPPDLLIGTVSEIIRVPGALFDQISLSSPVDLRDLRFVGVIKE